MANRTLDSAARDKAVPGQTGRARLAAPGDFAVALGLPLVAAISWLTPERSWPAISRAFGPFYGPVLATGGRAAIARRLQHYVAGGPLAGAMENVLRDVAVEDIRSLIGLLRDYRPGGWKPAIELAGRDHVERALGRRRGAILWVAHFAYGNLLAKMAFHRAGYAVSHLSHPRHGFSSTRFGMRCLNPVQTTVEDRYLRERVRLSPDGAGAALATLGDRLGGNGVVSISVRGDSRRPAMVPFLGGEIRIAVGAPVLAYKSAAALLPVFPLRTSENGFTVFVEPALEIDPALESRVAVADALGRYARLLERYVLDYPGQWFGWFHPSTIIPQVRTSF